MYATNMCGTIVLSNESLTDKKKKSKELLQINKARKAKDETRILLARNGKRKHSLSITIQKETVFYSLVFLLLLIVKNKVNIQMNCNIYIQLSRK